jgi:hypothetical protein
MASSNRQLFYGVTALIGVVVTWYFNIQFMIETGGFSLGEFIAATNANAAATSISNDLLVVVVTFFFWSFLEAKRLGMRHWWAYVILTFSIAIAFACPLFMLMRERKLVALGQVD